ncbi:4'-phosphopantetheinyl transferase family protein [Candidatus Magnetaquicoccus inordinatus]|uniref:4'-phosphopantetheinyl transferase family protein n=1 Tax=Candidatus Magnetaquicoccus inordinatus TaxID=2496818 RepID=UPI00187D4AB2|nr:4'-phosphopantetheinyl transferase superfamily protein [Candidatus Magnetaquicoccus inordinatus]
MNDNHRFQRYSQGIYLYAAPCFDLAIAQWHDPETRHRLTSWQTPSDLCLPQPQSMAVRALARWLLHHKWGYPAEEWLIERRSSGEPFLNREGGLPVPHLSFSHRGAWVGCAVSLQGTIGFDLELPRKNYSSLTGSEHFLSAAEQQWIAKEGEPAFLAFWTLRESFAKCQGEGLSLALAPVPRELLAARNHQVTFVWQHKHWFCQQGRWQELFWAVTMSNTRDASLPI